MSSRRSGIDSSEDLTDWEEGSESCDEDESIHYESLDQLSDRFAGNTEEGITLLKSTFDRVKQSLIDRLTLQFYPNLYDIYSLSGTHGMTEVVPVVQDGSIVVKRVHEGDDTPPFHIIDIKEPKRPRTMPAASDSPEPASKFSCPYRKRDPRNYSLPNWGPCVLTPLQTVARVK